MNTFTIFVQGSTSSTEYALNFDRLAKFTPDIMSTDATRQDRFVQGLNAMIARDVCITSVPGDTTYAQVFEKPFIAKVAKNKI